MKVITTSLKDRIDALAVKHGGLRAAGRAIQVDAGYLSRLRNGGKVAPSDAALHRMGLKRVTYYESTGGSGE